MFRNPLYTALAAAVSVIVFLPSVRRKLMHRKERYDAVMLWMDSLGLGVFTVVGIQTARMNTENRGFFLLVFVGFITGVGGGMLRDIFAGNTPYIFVKHVYACASIAGAVLCTALWPLTGGAVAMLCGALSILIVRLLAARFHWSLPRAEE